MMFSSNEEDVNSLDDSFASDDEDVQREATTNGRDKVTKSVAKRKVVDCLKSSGSDKWKEVGEDFSENLWVNFKITESLTAKKP